jgi:type II secretory pathway pseudopilin PulG
MSVKKQNGFLLISAVILVVVVGFLAVTVAYISTSGSRAVADQVDSANAFYVAQAGLQRAAYQLSSGGTTCPAINSHADFTDTAFGNGQFTVTATEYQPTSTTLSSAITNSASILPVASLTGYSGKGRVVIGSEAINYTGTSTSAGTCGTAPCLTGVIRGVAGTTAAAHSSGASVAQHQCNVVSTGAVPTIASPIAERELTNQVALATSGGSGSGGEAWAVGDHKGGENIAYWDGSSWSRQGPYSGIPNKDLDGIDMVSGSDGWAVGQNQGGNALFIRWDGSSWSRATGSTLASNVPDKDMYGVNCASANDCWAVGEDEGGDATFVHWDGSTWTRATGSEIASNVPDKKLFAVDCIDGSDCWAVGEDEGGDATFVNWNGTQWSRSTGSAINSNVPDKKMNAVSCVDANDCWAVGENDNGDATMVHWDGTEWSRATGSELNSNVPDKKLYDVSCPASDHCWAVGEKSGAENFVFWNGSQWSRVTGSGVSNKDYYGVSCDNTSDCWVVGHKRNTAHWDGSNWTGVSASAVADDHLRAVDIAGGSTDVGLENRDIVWDEDFN